MITVLGAGGSIANELARVLHEKGEPFRLVGRKPKPLPGAEVLAADLTDGEQAIRAVAGSSIVHLTVGLQYDAAVWRELWPQIMANTIEGCKRAGAKLIFFDNVYMYGKVNGPMTEQTPYAPCSKKGEIRAKIATGLMNEVRAGNLTAIIARAADFYSLDGKNSLANMLVFDPLSQRKTASWLVNANVPHSFTFTPDAARGLAMLSDRDTAWNQIWHLPTAPNPFTGKEFIEEAAKDLGVAAKYRVLSRPILKIAGFFQPMVRESYEMLYQNDSPYIFDSSKFANQFGFAGTPYAEGIRTIAEVYKSR